MSALPSNPSLRARRPALVFPLLAAMAWLPAVDAWAATQIRRFHATAVSLCQSALPAYESGIRKRPLAVQNEGADDAFVTCAFTTQWGGDLTDVTIGFRSAGNATATVSCTGVTGTQGASQPNIYVIKSATLPSSNAVGWNGNDYDTGDGSIPGNAYFSVSCKLPPGVGITSTSVQFVEDIGD